MQNTSSSLPIEQHSGDELAKSVLAGAAGGWIASWAMTRLRKLATGNAEEPAAVLLAQAVAGAILRRRLSPQEQKTGSSLVHYAMGTVLGGIYGGIVQLEPRINAGVGTLFGSAVWLAGDKVAVALPGRYSGRASSRPTSQPVFDFALHLAYGVVLEGCRRVIHATTTRFEPEIESRVRSGVRPSAAPAP